MARRHNVALSHAASSISRQVERSSSFNPKFSQLAFFNHKFSICVAYCLKPWKEKVPGTLSLHERMWRCAMFKKILVGTAAVAAVLALTPEIAAARGGGG